MSFNSHIFKRTCIYYRAKPTNIFLRDNMSQWEKTWLVQKLSTLNQLTSEIDNSKVFQLHLVHG